MPTMDAPPSRVTAGDSWAWAWSSADYLPSAGWVLSWRVLGLGVALSVSSVAEGDGFVASAPAASTAALAVPARGLPCTLIGWVSRAGERFEVYRAPCLLLPDPATITGDLRGHATRTLAAIEALLEGRATKDQQSYKIGDRELARIPVPELISLRDYYVSQAAREADAALISSGRRRPYQVLARFGRG